MGQRTDEFGLYKPDTNERNWGDELNETLDTIDNNLQSDENVEDLVAALLNARNGLAASYDDAAGVLTLDSHDVVPVSSDHAAGEGDVVLADASGGALTVTLPAPSETIMVNIKKTDGSANAVTIATPNSETIDGDANRTLTAENVSRTITSDGSNYYII